LVSAAGGYMGGMMELRRLRNVWYSYIPANPMDYALKVINLKPLATRN